MKNVSILARLALVLFITACGLGLSSLLADGFNNPQIPGEAAGCLIVFVLLVVSYGMLVVYLGKKWSIHEDETK